MKLLLLLTLILTAACGHENPCDPGQIYANGVCYAPVDAPPPASDAVTHD